MVAKIRGIRPVLGVGAIGLLVLAMAFVCTAQAKDLNQALLDAARDGQLTEIDRLLDEGADINARNPNGWTGLMFAVGAAHVGLAKKLLEKGADPDMADNDGVTPLMKAVKNADTEMVKLLLEHGADTALTDNSGKSPMDYAKGKSHKEVKKLLLKHGIAQ
ncbi:ankyrin repeat domain-containing protein [Thermodesulfobacteriota bacterium]